MSKLNPFFYFQTRDIGQILTLKSECAQKSTVNKTQIGCWIGLRIDQISDPIGSDSGSVRIGLVSEELLFLRKSCFLFRVACVSNRKICFSCITSLKIHHQLENHPEKRLLYLFKNNCFGISQFLQGQQCLSVLSALAPT